MTKRSRPTLSSTGTTSLNTCYQLSPGGCIGRSGRTRRIRSNRALLSLPRVDGSTTLLWLELSTAEQSTGAVTRLLMSMSLVQKRTVSHASPLGKGWAFAPPACAAANTSANDASGQ